MNIDNGKWSHYNAWIFLEENSTCKPLQNSVRGFSGKLLHIKFIKEFNSFYQFLYECTHRTEYNYHGEINTSIIGITRENDSKCIVNHISS